MVIVLFFFFCGCQLQTGGAEGKQRQQPQSAFPRLAQGGCAYSEVPVAERDELSGAVAWSIHHWSQGRGLRRNQQKEGHYLDDQASLIWSCGWASYKDSGQQQIGGMRQVDHWGRLAVIWGESTLFNAMIDLEAVHSAYAIKYRYFPLYSVFQSGWWLI